jgi:hypothetical protein
MDKTPSFDIKIAYVLEYWIAKRSNDEIKHPAACDSTKTSERHHPFQDEPS